MYAMTGASGAIGGRVAAKLAEQRHDLRLVVRDLARAPRLDGVDVEEATYADFEAMRASLVGVDALFLVSATEAEDRVDQHRTAVDAAAAAGVRSIVYLSFLAAAPDATFTFARDHWATEQHIRSAGLPHVFLRPSLYADLVPTWVTNGGIQGPAGDGKVAWVARDDVADAAVAALTGEGHEGQTYDITGPTALDLDQTARELSELSGQPVVYRDQTVDEARRTRSGAGEPWAVEGWISSYAAIAAGEMNVVSDAVATLTGHPPTSLAECLTRLNKQADDTSSA